MKQDHKPVAPKAAPLGAPTSTGASRPAAKVNELEKLELELDDQATHVHRIPKELINRMKEREQERRAAAAAPAVEEDAPSSYEQEIPDEQHYEDLSGVNDDRTAVFRPPPELLARAKRMRPPAKPDPGSEAPTKPPPPLDADGGAGTEPMAALAAAVARDARPLPAVPSAPMAPVVAKAALAPGARPTQVAPVPRTPSKSPAHAAPAAAPAPARAPAAPVAAAAPEPAAAAPPSARATPAAVLSISSPPRAPGDAPPSSSPGASPPSSKRVSSLPSDGSGLIPLLVDPHASSPPEPQVAPPSAIAPSSANLSTAFAKDTAGETNGPSDTLVDTSESSDGETSTGSSLVRWLVALAVAGLFAMTLLAWFRR
jgi:hypothetical protein